MTTFDKREQAFEAKLAHDHELRFRALVRRNKLLGLWAAEKLGKAAAEAEAYAASLVAADVEEGGEDKIFARIRSDLEQAGVSQSDHQIRRKMEEFLAAAVAEVKAGAGGARSRPLGH
ncbi:MAG: DUF1476 domain-containing protein [Methylocella sp.]